MHGQDAIVKSSLIIANQFSAADYYYMFYHCNGIVSIYSYQFVLPIFQNIYSVYCGKTPYPFFRIFIVCIVGKHLTLGIRFY